jgi:hypothetical protein
LIGGLKTLEVGCEQPELGWRVKIEGVGVKEESQAAASER